MDSPLCTGERAEFTALIFPGGVFPGHYRACAVAVDGHSEDGSRRVSEKTTGLKSLSLFVKL